MGEIRILDTLVEVSGDAASDAGSTPAASTRAIFPLRPCSHQSLPRAAQTLIFEGSLLKPGSTDPRRRLESVDTG
jgi:hypothetical protein